MLDKLKSLFFSLKWHVQRWIDDFRMLGLLIAFSLVLFLCGVCAETTSRLGLLAIMGLLAFSIYLMDKQEANYAEIQKTPDTLPVTSAVIDGYVNIIHKQQKELLAARAKEAAEQ